MTAHPPDSMVLKVGSLDQQYRTLIGMQVLRPQPRPHDLETLEGSPGTCIFQSLPGLLLERARDYFQVSFVYLLYILYALFVSLAVLGMEHRASCSQASALPLSDNSRPAFFSFVDKTQSPGHGYSIPLYSHHEKRIQK
jgi:hypothetical protein